MEVQPKKCESCGISLSEGDKFCPMCNTPVVETRHGLAYLRHISRTRPGLILFSSILIGIIVAAAAMHVPQYMENWNEKGRAALTTYHFEDAVDYYNTALKLNPSSEDALNGLGDAYYKLIRSQGDNYALPLNYYERANKSNKTGISIHALDQTGLIYLEMKEYDDAQKIFQRIIDQDEKNPLVLASAWYNKGMALKGLNDSKGAIECFNKSIAISSGEANSPMKRQMALASIGDILYYEGKISEAEQYYKRALEPDKNCNDCLKPCYNLINIYKNTNRAEEAKKYEEACIGS